MIINFFNFYLARNVSLCTDDEQKTATVKEMD
jgi:hypothetical protein